ncbi:MAG: twin-arginine translocase TatA/TatE family subunit [Gaiellales bacterium]
MPFLPSGWELVALLVVIVLIVGPAKAPGIARMLGRGAREVRETVSEPKKEIVAALTGDENPKTD